MGTSARRAATLALLAVVLAGCGHHSPGSHAPSASATSTREPSPEPSPTPSTTPTAAGRGAGIPDDFPLAQGLVTGGDTTVTTPRRGVKGIRLERRCWGEAWPGATVDRLVVQQVAPEQSLTRELALYPDRATAAAVGRQVRSRAARCHRLPASAEGAAMEVTPEDGVGTDVRHGRDSFAETLTDGEPGGSIFVFTLVGRAVLAVEDSGEWTRASALDGVRHLERVDRGLVASMCVFAAAGC